MKFIAMNVLKPNSFRPLLIATLLLSGSWFATPPRAAPPDAPPLSGTAATHLQNAQTAANARDFDTALTELDAALALAPDNPLILSGRARVCGVKGDFAGAVKSLSHLLELDPANLGALQMRAGLYQRLGEEAKADADFVASLRLSPADFAGAKTAALAASESQNWPAAFRGWDLLVQAKPADPVSLFNRGAARLRLNPPEMMFESAGHLQARQEAETQSEADFAAALKADPDFVSIDVFRTLHTQQITISDEDSQKDLADLGRALERHPESTELLLGRAAVAARLSLYTTSPDYAAFHQAMLDDYAHVLRLDPQNYTALLAHAEANRYEKPDAAIADLRTILAQKPDDIATLEMRAGLYKAQGNAVAAVADYDRVFALAPNAMQDEQLGFGRVLALRKLPDTSRALVEISRLIALNPDSYLYFSTRAEIELAQKDYLKALADIDKALELDPADKALFGSRDDLLKTREQILAAQKKAE